MADDSESQEASKEAENENLRDKSLQRCVRLAGRSMQPAKQWYST